MMIAMSYRRKTDLIIQFKLCFTFDNIITYLPSDVKHNYWILLKLFPFRYIKNIGNKKPHRRDGLMEVYNIVIAYNLLCATFVLNSMTPRDHIVQLIILVPLTS